VSIAVIGFETSRPLISTSDATTSILPSVSEPERGTSERDSLVALARRAAGGDRGATSQLLRVVAPSLLRGIRRMTGGGAEVDDLLQESMIALVAALPAFRGESSIERYASRIAVRTTIAARRRMRERQGWMDEHVRGNEPLERPVTTPDDETLSARRRRLLRELLAELPEAQAESLAMRVVLDYSLEEVAAATDAPVNTVRSRLRLAREALRERIEKDPVLLSWLEVSA
jgi:RNA polymerase sigma factor (sigma-70 family)